MKRRIASLFLAAIMLIPLATSVFPIHVHADGDDFRCPNCDSWLGDKDFCAECWFCEECEEICPDCGYCHACAVYDKELHCPECGDSCISEEYGNVPHCVACRKCEECVDLFETSEGLMCADCIEERGDSYIMCPHCGLNAIGTELEDLVDESDLETIMEALHPGDCGEHCETCYEEFLCPECGECTLCKGVELCESCGICEECADSYGYHCPDCGECYADAGQCPDGGEHCVNCCDSICENCGTCADGAGLEYCETCLMCENCWEHCEVCEECFEINGKCEDYGDHCAECCISEGWICEQCGRCTEALGLEFCSTCGLCEECCAENSLYYGLKDKCILDKETKPETLDPSKHDENHHILRYNSSSEECHDVWCIFPGCDYYLSDCTPHEFQWKTVKEPLPGVDGLKKGICVYCGHETEEAIPKIQPPVYYFIESPGDMEVLIQKNFVSNTVHIGVVGDPQGSTQHARVAAIPVEEGEVLPETWAELRKNIYYFDCISHDNSSDKSGVYKFMIGAESNAALAYGGKYVDFTAQGKKLTWRLAVYDGRGDGSVNKVGYSDPFTIDWDAKHTKHTAVWKSGTISDIDKKLYIENDYSANALKFYDGTYHWVECSVCGERLMPPSRHKYKLVGQDGNCKGGVEHYECKDCGHTFDIEVGYAVGGHTFSDQYKHNDKNHWQVCTVCGGAGPAKAHDLKQNVFRDCTKTIITTVCETCGYAHIEHESGTGHKFTSDGDFNGWYGDKMHHWKLCKVCGYVNKAEHSYVGGACSVCGIDIPQFAIVGAPCTHGTHLGIEMVHEIDDFNKALFLAGKWNATWYDDDTGNAVGFGKTYPLDQGDEGHSFRADVEMIGGDTYYAYMEGVTIKTEYINVKGYPATCASEGLKDHQVCVSCGGKFINGKEAGNVVIPKLSTHTYDFACDPVCNVCGFVRDVKHKWSDKYVYAMDGHSRTCDICGTKSGTEPHQFTMTWQSEADCEHDGVCVQKCKCGYSEKETVKAKGHKWVHADEVSALCVNEGFAEHYYCENCYAMATDAQGKNRVGPAKLLTPFDPDNHIGGNKIGYNKAEHYTICQCGAHIENAAHTFGEDGRCTVCGYKKGSTVKTSVDGLTKHDMVLPNCVTTGTKAYYTDKDGKMYLSSAGIKEVTANNLIIPVSTVRHVGGDQAHSNIEHWIACACGAKLDHGEHTFDDKGVCAVCGFVKIAPESESEGEETAAVPQIKDVRFPWWMLIIAAAVICVVILTIILLARKKKNDAPPPATPAPGGPAGSDGASDARENEEDTDSPKKE